MFLNEIATYKMSHYSHLSLFQHWHSPWCAVSMSWLVRFPVINTSVVLICNFQLEEYNTLYWEWSSNSFVKPLVDYKMEEFNQLTTEERTNYKDNHKLSQRQLIWLSKD